MDFLAARKPHERRAFPRVPCGIRLQIAASGENIVAELMNISPSGLFLKPSIGSIRDSLRLTALLASDTLLVLRLRLAGSAGPFEATARVAWKSDLGVGIDFLQVSEPLANFVQHLAEAADPAALLARIEPDPTLSVR